MPADLLLARLRCFLLVLSGLLMAGTVGELIFIEHVKEPTQWIPFGLCGLGMIGVGAVLVRPRRPILLALRASMSVVVIGSAFGGYEHVTGNLAFHREIHPNSTWWKTLRATLGGPSPLLAPGVLALAAVLAIAATYHHSALAKPPQQVMFESAG